MSSNPAPLLSPTESCDSLLHALGWYARDVLDLERLLNVVTVKRRRNLARPIRRRRSAFRDPVICYDFLAMAWLGATRLSHIERHLEGRRDLARALGLPRFCDHTTAHNFLNAFHVTHLRQLDEANARLLRRHGASPSQLAPILDVDLARRVVRRPGRRDRTYQWAVAFCAGEAVAQQLSPQPADSRALVLDVLSLARATLGRRPALVRLVGAARELLRALARQRIRFLATTSWAAALAQGPPLPAAQSWVELDGDARILDLGASPDPARGGPCLRTLLAERPARGPCLPRERVAIVTSLLDLPPQAVLPLAASICQIAAFYGHPRWPLADGKPPSSDPRGLAAYLRLATIAMNVLRLFARQLGAEWTPSRLHARLRAVPWDF